MVREYIGARYVPKFMGLYDATQEYEALCVVDNGMGTSYISKIPTPAGTPLTDTTYWFIYGASSGAILDLQNRVSDLETLADKSYLVDGSRVITVEKSGGMFTSINDAIAYAQTLNAKCTIYVGSGNFNESINLAGNSNINIIGAGIQNTIINSDTNDVDTLFITGSGYIANLSLYCFAPNTGHYACHIEAGIDSTSGWLIFNNVYFYSQNTSGMGAGLGKGFRVECNNCIFEGHETGGRALYIHNFANPTENMTMRFEAKNCEFKHDLQAVVIENAKKIYYPANTYNSVLYLSFQNCHAQFPYVRVSDGTNIRGYVIENDDEIILLESSTGNNLHGVDYDTRLLGFTQTGRLLPTGQIYMPMPFSTVSKYYKAAINYCKTSDGASSYENDTSITFTSGCMIANITGADNTKSHTVIVTARPKLYNE